MIIELCERGWLSIMRKDIMKQQLCCKHGVNAKCGDWCPLFDPKYNLKGHILTLNLCEDRSYKITSCKDRRI